MRKWLLCWNSYQLMSYNMTMNVSRACTVILQWLVVGDAPCIAHHSSLVLVCFMPRSLDMTTPKVPAECKHATCKFWRVWSQYQAIRRLCGKMVALMRSFLTVLVPLMSIRAFTARSTSTSSLHLSGDNRSGISYV